MLIYIMYIYCVTYTSELITRGANMTTNSFFLGMRGEMYFQREGYIKSERNGKGIEREEGERAEEIKKNDLSAILTSASPLRKTTLL